ncbi:lipase family protein [Nocardia amikacinitolerans]|uniref:lipase family protein n=1 Tax=Nocardia amikacinitolerans TaxID=756689 RepID=UPI0020A3436A|nr:lipase family protein [Nocardia amikacinitolerans]MCP2291736.1 Secretory lipase [Nocardia amikacinitolerans]
MSTKYGRPFPAFRVLLRGFAVAAMVSLSLLAHAAPSAAIPRPDADPFYAAPADLADYPAGVVTRSRPIALLGLPLPVSAWQVQYRTNDAGDAPIPGMATVMVPNLPWLGKGERPLLSYQVPEDSLGSHCAPSYALRGGWELSGVTTYIDTPFIADALRRGWAVVVSDYEGPRSRFLDGVNSGRGVLDGIRAARAFGAGGVGPASPIGAYGYSGGAFATLWAAQLQPDYAPDVRFAGITSGGVPADWPAIARGVDGGVQAGLAMLIVLAIARDHPEFGVAELLNERGHAMLAEDGSACGLDLVAKYIGARVDDFAIEPELLAHPAFRAATDAQELGASAPRVPAYLYHSITDDVIPVAGFTALLDRYCALGADITFAHSTLPGHNPTAIVEAFGAMNYLADRFAGVPVAAGCHAR